MERKKTYQILLLIVLFLTVFYTLGIAGVVPFEVSYHITILFIFVFIALRMDYHRRRKL